MPLLIKAGSGKSELPELFLHYYSLQLAGWFAADFFFLQHIRPRAGTDTGEA